MHNNGNRGYSYRRKPYYQIRMSAFLQVILSFVFEIFIKALISVRWLTSVYEAKSFWSCYYVFGRKKSKLFWKLRCHINSNLKFLYNFKNGYISVISKVLNKHPTHPLLDKNYTSEHCTKIFFVSVFNLSQTEIRSYQWSLLLD